MYSYKFGGKDGSTFDLDIADDLVVVRTKKNKTLSDAIKSRSAKNTLAQLLPIAQFPEAGVSVLQCRQAKDRLLRLRDQARQLFKKEKDIALKLSILFALVSLVIFGIGTLYNRGPIFISIPHYSLLFLIIIAIIVIIVGVFVF